MNGFGFGYRIAICNLCDREGEETQKTQRLRPSYNVILEGCEPYRLRQMPRWFGCCESTMDFAKFAADMKAAKAAKASEERAAKERALQVATVKSTKPATAAASATPATSAAKPSMKVRRLPARTDNTAEQNWSRSGSGDASGFSRGIRITVDGKTFVIGLPDKSRMGLINAIALLTSERGMLGTTEERTEQIDATIYAIQSELQETAK